MLSCEYIDMRITYNAYAIHSLRGFSLADYMKDL